MGQQGLRKLESCQSPQECYEGKRAGERDKRELGRGKERSFSSYVFIFTFSYFSPLSPAKHPLDGLKKETTKSSLFEDKIKFRLFFLEHSCG